MMWSDETAAARYGLLLASATLSANRKIFWRSSAGRLSRGDRVLSIVFF
jgi:hypothetical protein